MGTVRCWIPLLLMLALPLVSAAEQFEETLPVTTFEEGDELAIMLGALEGVLISDGQSDILGGVGGFVVSGLQQFCSQSYGSSCDQDPRVTYEVEVFAGSDLLLYTPGIANRFVESSHAVVTLGSGPGLGLPADAVDQGLAGSFYEGLLRWDSIETIPVLTSYAKQNEAGFLSIQSNTNVRVDRYVDGVFDRSISELANDRDYAFSGSQIAITDARFQSGYLEAQPGSTLSYVPADSQDASDHIDSLDAITIGGESLDLPLEYFDYLPDGLEVGTLLQVPLTADVDDIEAYVENATLAKIETMEVEVQDGSAEAYGTAGLVIQDGQVKGGNPLLYLLLVIVLFVLGGLSFLLRKIAGWEKHRANPLLRLVWLIPAAIALLLFNLPFSEILEGDLFDPVTIQGVPVGLAVEIFLFIGLYASTAVPLAMILRNASGFLPVPALAQVLPYAAPLLSVAFARFYLLTTLDLMLRVGFTALAKTS